MLNNCSLSLFDVVKGGEEYKQPKRSPQLTVGFADSVRLQKKGGVCTMCVNTACCLSLWLCTGCHHQKGGVCKGKVSDNIRSQVSMMTNDHHACLQTNATHHLSYPFLCLSKSVIILKNICGQSVIMTKCMKITKYEFLQVCRL